MAKSVFFFGDGHPEGDPKRRDLLGGKGAGLAEMTALDLPVPPGFTISTKVCNAFAGTQSIPEEARAEVAAALARLEASMGARLGDATSPLLVSVRSGARASMPGMMDTILNLGLNDAVAEGLAARTKSPRFAYDAYRRFVAMHASIALGVSREPFEHALDETRARVATAKGIDRTRLNAEELKRAVPDSDIPAEELRALVTRFKAIVKKETGRDFPTDPREQLWQAIEAVFKSWNNHRAIVYRRMHDIPDDWGTACNVQAMVFGNLGETSATGVAFTRDPSTGEKKLYGEWLPNAQGEDVVAGIRTPLPIRSVGRGPDLSLETRMPDAYRELSRIAATLEKHFRDMQDLEFTIQDGKLYMLQCRTGEARGARRGLRRGRHGGRGAHHAGRGRAARRSGRPRSAPPPHARSEGAQAPPRARARREPRGGERAHRLQRRRGRAPRRAGQAGHPGARRDLARGHPRDEGGARHPHRARRDDEPRGRRRARDGQAVRRRRERRRGQLRDADDDGHGLRRRGSADGDRDPQEGRHHHDRRRQRPRLRAAQCRR